MFNAKVVDSFLTSDECTYLIDVVSKVEPWENGGSEFWNNRSLNAVNIYKNIDKEAGALLYRIRNNIKNAIMDVYELDKEVYPDLTQIVRWFPGMKQSPHADDMTNTEGNDSFHHRHFGSIIYLNDSYTGGHTYYPQYNLEVTPKVGSLAIHPGDADHLHGVTEVEGGIRYTVASFWTFEEGKFDGWALP
jgi:hypothetical protein